MINTYGNDSVINTYSNDIVLLILTVMIALYLKFRLSLLKPEITF